MMFGFTEAQIAQFGMTFGVGAFMLYMLFIIFNMVISVITDKEGEANTL